MATPYEKVYGRFLNRVTDFNLSELDDHTLGEMLKGWLHSAIVNVRTSSDLSLRNDEEEAFDDDLSDRDIELLAMGMTMAWLDQTLNSTELTLMMIGGKEEKLKQYLLSVRYYWKRYSVFLRICWETLRAITPKQRDETCSSVNGFKSLWIG